MTTLGTGLTAPKALFEDFSLEDVDEAVKSKLPEGATLTSANAHGASFWTQTARLDVTLSDGSRTAYFLKVAKYDLGKGMLHGEFESAKLLHTFSPEGLPRPVAFGTYTSDSDSHFYLCTFLEMTLRLPDPGKFCAVLAKMHQNSIGHAPEGKYGFHVSTYQGNMPQNNTWTNTWEEYYVRGLKDFMKQERAVHGRSDELEHLLVPFFEKVVPRLLRPLEWGEKEKIKPCLIHGDIWYGNIAEIAGTDKPIMFDPAAFWAHNEYELGSFRVPRYRLGPQWLEEYNKHFPISEPERDFDDRNLIYSIHTHFCASTLYPSDKSIRQQAIADIRLLVEKYPDGLDGYAGERPNGA